MADQIDWFYCSSCKKDTIATALAYVRVLDTREVYVEVRVICNECGSIIVTADSPVFRVTDGF